MINYVLSGLMGFVVAIALLVLKPQWDGLAIAAIAAAAMVPFGLIATPYCRAAWMWFDHTAHPLEPNERLSAVAAAPDILKP